jgi:hypothetical protein
MLRAALPSTDLRQLQSRVHGRLICKGDGDYNQARRVWNGGLTSTRRLSSVAPT